MGRFAAAALCLAAKCGGTPAGDPITGVRLTVTRDAALGLDQLEVVVSHDARELLRERRPEKPRALAQSEAIQIVLRGAPDGAHVRIDVTGLYAGVARSRAQTEVKLRLSEWVESTAHLAAELGPDAPDGAADGVPDGPAFTCESGTWTAMSSAGAPEPRSLHSTVWTGSEMIVWGGFPYTNTGGSYDPVEDSWTALTTVGAPSPRRSHTAVWTGSEMIVWGGGVPGEIISTPVADGAGYLPSEDTWTPLAKTAVAARFAHSAVWTGSEMIVWGGTRDLLSPDNSGGRYSPAIGSWTPMAKSSLPGRAYHSAVWTGSQMTVWGGLAGITAVVADGGRYDPTSNLWLPTSSEGAPSARYLHSTVWTGSQMLIWLGLGGGFPAPCWADGGLYDPTLDVWSAMPPSGAPARHDAAAVWHEPTGTAFFWGGVCDGALHADGAGYDDSTGSWVAMGTEGAPSPRALASMVSTGSELLIWGGAGDSTGARYCP